MTACHYYSAIANIEEVEMNVAEEDNSTTLEGNKSCDDEECDTDDGDMNMWQILIIKVNQTIFCLANI